MARTVPGCTVSRMNWIWHNGPGTSKCCHLGWEFSLYLAVHLENIIISYCRYC